MDILEEIYTQEVTMAVHLSTIKRARQNRKRRMRNRTMKSAVRRAERRVRQTEDKDHAVARLREASSVFDRAASKGVLHRRTVARHKSRMAKRVNRLGDSPKATASE
jgi:small subunit ribosomal protein S20